MGEWLGGEDSVCAVGGREVLSCTSSGGAHITVQSRPGVAQTQAVQSKAIHVCLHALLAAGARVLARSLV